MNGGANFGQRKQARAQAVVDVVSVVGDVVGDRSRLRLKAGVQAQVQTLDLIVAENRSRDATGPIALGGPG